MPSSISDPAVQAALDFAQKHQLFPSPGDWRDCWIYFLLIDRFNNPENPPRNQPYDGGFSGFQGGTFRGVQDKLPYLKDMGVGAIWLSPVLQNRPSDTHSYHGYGVQNFLAIEPRLASEPERAEDELRELIAEAHKMGLYVILDIVLHHAGNVFSYVVSGGEKHELDWQEQTQEIRWHKDGILPQELQRDEFWTRRGAADSTEHGFHPSGDFSSLKAFDADYAEADGTKPIWDILIKAHQYLIAKFDIDGFRIDTLKFISPEFAHAFGHAMREFAGSAGKDNFLMFGEIYDSEETISQFIGRGSDGGGADVFGISSALDYPLFFALPNVAQALPDAAPAAVAAVFDKRAEVEQEPLAGHGEAGEYFVTFLDNHDQDKRFDGPAALALTLLFTLQGIPCVYYGTEQGLKGHKTKTQKDDSRVREALWGKQNAFDTDSPLYQTIAALSALRRDHPALRCGGQFFRPLSGNGADFDLSRTPGGVLAYSRILERDEVLVAANTSPKEVFAGEIVIDWDRSPAGARWQVLWSNQEDALAPGTIVERQASPPLRVLPVSLRPGEVQVLSLV